MHEARNDRLHYRVAEGLQNRMCRFEYVRFVSFPEHFQPFENICDACLRRRVPHRIAHKTFEALELAGDKKSEPFKHLIPFPHAETFISADLRVRKRLITGRYLVRLARTRGGVCSERLTGALKNEFPE